MTHWTLRPAEVDDAAFLRRLYASTRHDELAGLGWPAGQLQAFLDMQFDAQDGHYRQCFPQARCEIVSVAGGDVGRLCTDRSGTAIHLIDIALLPAWRSRGLGGGILRALLDEASAEDRPAVLHVVRGNPARRLYERLGFRATELRGMHQQMVRTPPTRSAGNGSTHPTQELIHEQST